MNLLKIFGMQILLCLFMLNGASKQLKSLTTIDTLVDSVVQRYHIRFGCERSQIDMGPGSIPSSGTGLNYV